MITVLCALGAVGYWRYSEAKLHQFRIVFLNVGQGDSALIQLRNGEHMLIDCGPDSTVLSRLGAELPWYVRTIDTLLITHPDSDHYAGCIDVLKRYRVRRIVTNGEIKPDAQYATLQKAIANEPKSIVFAQSGFLRLLIAPGTMLEFLSPDPELPLKIAADDSNNRGIVFRLLDEPTKTSVLFAADMEEPLEHALLKKYCAPPPVRLFPSNIEFSVPCPALTAAILKAGHHGSQTSSSDDFIAAAAPKTAIISVGAHNKFGHPSLRIIRRFERAGITILRTDKLGDIVVN